MSIQANINKQGIFKGGLIEESGKAKIFKDNFTIGANLLSNTTEYVWPNKLTRTASKNDDFIHTNMKVTLESNKTYTFSFWTTGTMPQQIEIGFMFNNGYDYYKFMSGAAEKHIKISDNLYRHEESFTVTRDGSYNLRMDWNISGETHSGWNFKIEEGSVATPWIPNSADPLYNQLSFSTLNPTISKPIKSEHFYEI